MGIKPKKKVCKGERKADHFPACGKMVYIFSNGLCIDCYKRWKQFKIPKVSEKRKAENEAYKLLRENFLKQDKNKICPITGKQATEIHHTYSGKDRAKYYLITSTWIAVSREGHNWIHEHPKEARQKGYLK